MQDREDKAHVSQGERAATRLNKGCMSNTNMSRARSTHDHIADTQSELSISTD
jgi:hypothetical protein